jgi:hypothetical protein
MANIFGFEKSGSKNAEKYMISQKWGDKGVIISH